MFTAVYCLVSVIGWDIKMTSHHIQIQMQVLETFVIAELGDDRRIGRDHQNWRLRSTGQRAIWNEISSRLTKCIKPTKMKMTKIIVIYQLCLEQFFFFFLEKFVTDYCGMVSTVQVEMCHMLFEIQLLNSEIWLTFSQTQEVFSHHISI